MRNTDLGRDHHAHVSLLSPYVRRRLVLESEVIDAVCAHHGPARADKFVQEVWWRTYFKGHLETRPQLWTRYQRAVQHHHQQMTHNVATLYDQVCSGRTGVECMDVWAQELKDTGYLHNHARMWFASIWIFTFELPWELGADFMLRHLLDGDPASNTLSWRWVAGLHTRGKTYLARVDNIETHTNGRFRPHGLATTAKALVDDAVAPQPPRICAPPQEGDALLLLTAEDLHAESLPMRPMRVVGVVGVRVHEPDVGPKVTVFERGALDDAAHRAAAHFAVPTQVLDAGEDVVAAVVGAARAAGTSRVVTAYAPVGPTATWLSWLCERLTERGVELVEVQRRYDTQAWPWCTRGFGQLNEARLSF
jgi:deoxyribodipyrimidine photo-lyase